MKDFTRPLNDVSCQTEAIGDAEKSTQTIDPGKIGKLVKDYVRNGWTQKIITLSKKEIRCTKFPILGNQIMDKGFSMISRPVRKFSDAPATPDLSLSTMYLKKASKESIEKF